MGAHAPGLKPPDWSFRLPRPWRSRLCCLWRSSFSSVGRSQEWPTPRGCTTVGSGPGHRAASCPGGPLPPPPPATREGGISITPTPQASARGWGNLRDTATPSPGAHSAYVTHVPHAHRHSCSHCGANPSLNLVHAVTALDGLAAMGTVTHMGHQTRRLSVPVVTF